MKHGTLTAYHKHGCRCDVCSAHAMRHMKRWRLDRSRGITRLVDAQPLRDHVAALKAAGMSHRAIALSAGWRSRNALDAALSHTRVHHSTMARVLAVTPEMDTRGDAYVDATGARRRLQALAVNGWTTRQLGAKMGHADQSTALHIQSGRTVTIRKRTADKVAALFEELWDVPGPSTQTARWAAKRGFAPALAWDDDLIDDPTAAPDLGEPTVRVNTGRPIDHIVEDFRDTFDSHGGNTLAAAQRLGMTTTALERALHRARAAGHEVTFTRGAA